MKILITGGAGFIGSRTAVALLDRGHKVTVLDNFDVQSHPTGPRQLDKRAVLVNGDATDGPLLGKLLEQTDAVLHLAGAVGLGQSMYQPWRFMYINSMGATNLYQRLLEGPKPSNVRKVVVASSKVIYGEGSYRCKTHGLVFPPLRGLNQLEAKDWELHCPECGEHTVAAATPEWKPPQTPSVYALSKYDTERLALMCGESLKIPTIALRYFTAFGPGQSLSNPYTGVCSIFISRVRNGRQPVIYEDGRQVKDLTYIDDVVQANVLALENDGATGAYNIGSGVPTAIGDVAKQVCKLLGSDIEPLFTGEYRLGDTRHDYADITKAKRELGFSPRWKFSDGLKKLVEWSLTQPAEDRFEKAEAERKAALGG
jgi:dTDP-L-rhamnose 4-epimerase